MKHLNALADLFEKKSQKWTIVFRVCQMLTLFNALLFGLYIWTPITGPFELIFGRSNFNLWISVGVCLVLTLILSTAYHRSHGYHDLAKRALEAPDSLTKPE